MARARFMLNSTEYAEFNRGWKATAIQETTISVREVQVLHWLSATSNSQKSKTLLPAISEWILSMLWSGEYTPYVPVQDVLDRWFHVCTSISHLFRSSLILISHFSVSFLNFSFQFLLVLLISFITFNLVQRKKHPKVQNSVGNKSPLIATKWSNDSCVLGEQPVSLDWAMKGRFYLFLPKL